MKILENGVLRDMTPEEISHTKKVDAEMQKLIPPVDENAMLEEFISRLAEADTLLEIIEIAKDIKARQEGGNE